MRHVSLCDGLTGTLFLGCIDVRRVCGVPEHFNLPWHLAKERGLFDKHGVDVEFIEEPLGTGAMVEKVRMPRRLSRALLPSRPTSCDHRQTTCIYSWRCLISISPQNSILIPRNAQLEKGDVDVIVALTEGLVLKILQGSDMRLLGTYVGSPLCWAVSAAGPNSVSCSGSLHRAW